MLLLYITSIIMYANTYVYDYYTFLPLIAGLLQSFLFCIMLWFLIIFLFRNG